MKTQEQQKAELLDKWMSAFKGVVSLGHKTTNYEKLLVEEYDSITAQKPLSADPFADEIFGARILNVLNDVFYGDTFELRLSECPHINTLIGRKNFGAKSVWAYTETMRDHGFNDKLV